MTLTGANSLWAHRAIAERRPRATLAHLIASLYQRGGTLVRTLTAPFHLSDCGDGAAPCTCAWPGTLRDTYQVSGADALSGCDGCDASGDPLWDGTLHHIGAGCVWWAADDVFDPLSISGVSLDITYTQLLLRTDVTPCRWELYIACGSATNPTKTMWAGYKTTGSTPAGTYEFVSSDCGNTTASLDVS